MPQYDCAAVSSSSQAPDSQREASPLSGRKSTYLTVQICGASSGIRAVNRALEYTAVRFINGGVDENLAPEPRMKPI
jgi:hypothetical protein